MTVELAEDAMQKKAVLYDKGGDAHYDTISAFIKSVRGSDPDAAVYWLARSWPGWCTSAAATSTLAIFRRSIC